MNLKVLLLVFIIAFFGLSYSLAANEKRKNDSLDKHFLEKKPSFKAIDLIKGDTTVPDTSSKPGPLMPGGPRISYNALQDSAYFRDLSIKIPVTTRLNNDMKRFMAERETRMELLKGTPWRFAVKNIEEIPRKLLEPSPEEMVQYQINIRRGMAAPGVQNLMNSGLSMPVGMLATLLGLAEDVSPEIKYELEYPAEVTITIYSVNAKAVTVIFDGKQVPGNYKITWNFRDDNGRKVAAGDYVGEVRIGRDKYVRKRIVKP